MRRTHRFCLSIVVFLVMCASPATGLAQAPQRFPLWQAGAPGALGQTDGDIPALTVYKATHHAIGTGIIVAPGGGYRALSMNMEGREVAALFNSMGVTAFVLEYRLGPRYHHPTQLGDAQRAIRIVRSRAAEFGVAPDRIGMMGFSAGGHLTATAGTRFDDGKADAADPIDRAGSRPDFLILAYPVISFDPAIAHGGSVRNLLGESPDPKLIELLSNDLHVTAQTPPTFLFHTSAGYRSPRRSQSSLLPGAAAREGVGGIARLRKWSARRWPRPLGSGAQQLADAAVELAPRSRFTDEKALGVSSLGCTGVRSYGQANQRVPQSLRFGLKCSK